MIVFLIKNSLSRNKVLALHYRIFRLLVERIRKEFEFDLLVKEEAFHLAIATKWRAANNVTPADLERTIESFFDSKKSQILLKFFEEFHTK